MGLDMYLFGIKKDKERSLGDPSEGRWKEVCYWRKANAIHKWFNIHFIKQQDPWGYYEITEDDLQGLLLICKLLRCLKDNPNNSILSFINTKWFNYVQNESPDWDYDAADLIAQAILPPDNMGCFFGSGAVDDWYWENIDDTIKQLTKVLEDEEGYRKFFYMASW